MEDSNSQLLTFQQIQFSELHFPNCLKAVLLSQLNLKLLIVMQHPTVVILRLLLQINLSKEWSNQVFHETLTLQISEVAQLLKSPDQDSRLNQLHKRRKGLNYLIL
jgi:hypothetical protein